VDKENAAGIEQRLQAAVIRAADVCARAWLLPLGVRDRPERMILDVTLDHPDAARIGELRRRTPLGARAWLAGDHTSNQQNPIGKLAKR